MNLLSIKKITVVGGGYVGLSLAALLGQKKVVNLVEIDKKKVSAIKRKKCYLDDKELKNLIENTKTHINVSENLNDFINTSDIFIICLPTNYDVNAKFFDTSLIEKCLANISKAVSSATVLIKSTIPLGFTKKMNKKFKNIEIIFSPEFLREGSALADNISPSRIIVGSEEEKGHAIAELFLEFTDNNPGVFLMSSSEAESVKLFSNTYLAMRVGYFNELDSFCIDNELNTQNVIKGVCSDGRIGSDYNNPSFGYGGYCLPKDTLQLLSEFKNTPNSLIEATVATNNVRAKYIADHILRKSSGVIGIYRLTMKTNSDNLRDSAILNVLDFLKKSKRDIVIYEPLLSSGSFLGINIISDLNVFLETSSIIVSNRADQNLKNYENKLFTRDIFKNN